VFIDIPGVPILCNVFWKTREEALNAPKGSITLAFCGFCGHIFNVAFDPDLMKYDQDYENSLHFSPRFQEYAISLAERLIQAYDLHHKDIIEVGCGKGDFLTMLCERGQNRGIGFDPSYMDGRIDREFDRNITIVRDFYSERYSHYSADMICCRHVLEHIQYPREFIKTVRRAINDRLNTIVFFEVPNVIFTLKDLGIWDLIYEHCGYFSEESLSYLFESCGFTMLSVKDAFGGQFLCIDALPVSDKRDVIENQRYNKEQIATYVSAFSTKYYGKISEWRQKLEETARDKKRIVLWGAGSKGVTFLNVLNDQSRDLEYIVDVNPFKQGMYIGGTGQQIVSPEFLREYQPDIILVMNPVYRDEIQHMVKSMNVECNFADV